jgi:BirA family transcriptional regulator, biotin operon repressor / biotin---[acetyl-CoA-carboxylase] ligase
LSHRTTKLIPKTGHAVGDPFIALATIDSTNNYAMAKVHAGEAIHGTVYFAHEQTCGKGQRGKTWTSTPGQNIMMSAVLEPPSETPGLQFPLSMALALACRGFLSQYILNGLTIKWPNDLYWQDRKLGGILIENIVKGRKLVFSVAGIGININQTGFESHIRNPVSLNQVTGKTFEIMGMARQLCMYIDEAYLILRAGKLKKIWKEYNEFLYKRDQVVQLKKGNDTFKTTIREVSPEGRLICAEPNAGVFEFGEVEWIL